MNLMDPKDLILVFENDLGHTHLQRLDEVMEDGPITNTIPDYRLIGVREDS